MSVEIDGYIHLRSVLLPRTPSPNQKMQTSSNSHSFPISSRMQMSVKTQPSNLPHVAPSPASVHSNRPRLPATSPLLESSIAFSASELDDLQICDDSGHTNGSDGIGFTDSLNLNIEPSLSPDPLCLFSPVACTEHFVPDGVKPGKYNAHEQLRPSLFEKDDHDDGNLGNNSTGCSASVQDAIIPHTDNGITESFQGFRRPRSSSPLEFPSSPDLDAPSFSPADSQSSGLNPFLVSGRSSLNLNDNFAYRPCGGSSGSVNKDEGKGINAAPQTSPLAKLLPNISVPDCLIHAPTPRTPSSALSSEMENFGSLSKSGKQNYPCSSMSPLTPPPALPRQASYIALSPSPGPTQGTALSPIVIPPDPEPPGRAYSLRRRSAKQLNPFEYDRRRYKHQLRSMPEAIVKDPNLDDTRGARKDRYREETRRDSKHIEEDGNDDEDDEWHARETRRDRRREREAQDAKMRELGIELMSPEDEHDVLEKVSISTDKHGEESRPKGRKRKRAIRIFPLANELESIKGLSSKRQYSAAAHSPLRRISPTISPRPVRVSSLATPDKYTGVDVEFVDFDDVSMGTDLAPLEALPSASNALGRDRVNTNGPIVINISEDEGRSQSGRGRLKCGHPDSHDFEVQILETDMEGSENSDGDSDVDEESQEVELTGKAKKQYKALSRMMPAALRMKLMAENYNSTKPKPKPRGSKRESDDDEDEPLQPGKGRKRIISRGSMDPQRYEIKGDIESESDGPNRSLASDREVIVVDDDGSEEDAERALEESEDGLDNDDIQTWLAPELPEEELAITNGHASRIRVSEADRDKPRGGDLIDRMLQRTRRVGPRPPRPEHKQSSKVKDTVTREARRSDAGNGRQTKLAFPKADGRAGLSRIRREKSIEGKSPKGQTRLEHYIDKQDEKVKKIKKRTRNTGQPNLFVLRRDGHKITSGRSRQIIHVDFEDTAFHEALAPTQSTEPSADALHPKSNITRRRAHGSYEQFHRETCIQPDVFDIDMDGGPGQRYGKISLDFDIDILPSGIMLGSDGYVGRGRLFDFVSTLKGETEASIPSTTTLLGIELDPDVPVTQLSLSFASAFDKLYDASLKAADDPEIPATIKFANAMMHALCQMITFRALRADDTEEALLVTIVSEQIGHLIGRIDDRVESISADGHSLDHRSFALYWFALEVHLRLAYAHRKRRGVSDDTTFAKTYAAEKYCVQLVRRLLEYGFERTTGFLQNNDHALEPGSSNARILELWVCISYVAPFLASLPLDAPLKPVPPFWRVVETAMDAQSSKFDSQLYQSERIWRMVFSLCAVSQFSIEGLSTSTIRLEAYWPIIKKALKCIRLSADEYRDNNKPASTLHKRDTYLRLVTARCYLLCSHWNWRLDDADDMFHELCAIFRSRRFSNLLGEPNDFPAFVRNFDLTLLDAYQTTDTAYGLILKLLNRAAKDFLKLDVTSRLRGAKLVRLLSLTVPVGSTSFTKTAPPAGQGLSMLYNRYSAVFVAIYVDPSSRHIRTRLQQARRYITFKDADCDSRAAAIRAMMHITILLHHLSIPPDDVYLWAVEMIDDLTTEMEFSKTQTDGSQTTRDQLIVLIQLLLGAFRTITNTPTLDRNKPIAAGYPDTGFLQAWMSRLLSSPLAKDHRTGLEICKCIQSFLKARRAFISIPPIPRSTVQRVETQESQDEFGDDGFDLNDPELLALLGEADMGYGGAAEETADKNAVADSKASEILDGSSQSLYTCLCIHLECNSTIFGGPYHEADQWLECWLGCGDTLVRNKRRDWNYYFQLGEFAWKGVIDLFRRTHLRLRFMLAVLQLDPYAFKPLEKHILVLWMESIVSPEVTIEHSFVARVLTVDGLRHALFQNLPCAIDPDTGNLAFGVNQFKELRLPLVQATLRNVSTAANAGTEDYISLVEVLVGTLRQWIEIMEQDLRRFEYSVFGRNVISSIRSHDVLKRHPKLQDLLAWSDSL
ncbi:hypothetical protein K439DRAFT_1394210 [Ramaria rubella]|nr:hypothetical protein K439DRAFT_1394210 [Ramaria rubella]